MVFEHGSGWKGIHQLNWERQHSKILIYYSAIVVSGMRNETIEVNL
jgi:hypothetical protein